jgi:hypothetical protein
MNSTVRCGSRIALGAAALALMLGGCVAKPIPQARLSKSAFITAGDTNTWLIASGKSVSVVEVDGTAPENSKGPIELAPGAHKVKLKCNDVLSEQEITAAAGDVFQFSVYVDPNDHHFEARLQKIRSTHD